MKETMTDIRSVAERLAKQHAALGGALQEILLFPAKKEIRLVEVEKNGPPHEGRIQPFYFAATDEVPFVTAIALALPEERGKLRLPKGWGSWAKAVTIWQRRRNGNKANHRATRY